MRDTTPGVDSEHFRRCDADTLRAADALERLKKSDAICRRGRFVIPFRGRAGRSFLFFVEIFLKLGDVGLDSWLRLSITVTVLLCPIREKITVLGLRRTYVFCALPTLVCGLPLHDGCQ